MAWFIRRLLNDAIVITGSYGGTKLMEYYGWRTGRIG
jgi:hypothetical protein